MKKIALVVAAILVIGIQGCTTDDSLINQRKESDSLTKNTLLLTDQDIDKSCNGCIPVFYAESLTSSDRDTFRVLMRKQVFNVLLNDLEESCGLKESWVISGYDTTIFYNSGVRLKDESIIISEGNHAISVQPSSDDDETHIPKSLFSSLISNYTIIGNFKFSISYIQEKPQSCRNILN